VAAVTIILILFPLLLLIKPVLAVIALVGAIVWMTVDRTRSHNRTRPRKRAGSDEPQYQAGYEN
jgi:hypothetical protein